MEAVNAAIAQARAAASNVAPTPAVPALVGSTALAMAGGRPVSLREMLAESTAKVDAYLKIVPAGFNIGDDKKSMFEEIPVEFRFADAKVFYGVRYNKTYEKSFDRIVNARSKRPWADCVAEAQRLDPKCRGDYRGVDVAFTVLETLTAKDGKTVLIEAGQKLGWTSSITNWNDFAEFAAPFFELMDAGVISDKVTVRGKIVHQERTNKDNTWGVATFAAFEVVGLGEDEGQA